VYKKYMSGCALQVASQIEALEAGAQPYPVFFAGSNCNSSQYPSAGQPIPPSLYATTLNLRTLACRQGTDAQGNGGTPAESINYSNNGNLNISGCPLPVIQSMIIPDGIQLTFQAPSNTLGIVYDPGALVFNKSVGTNNIYTVDLSPSTQVRLGSTLSGKFADTGCKSDNSGGAWSGNGLMKRSFVSCGQPFWPSLTSGALTGNANQPVQISGNTWVKGADYGGHNGQISAFCQSPYGPSGGASSFETAKDTNETCQGGQQIAYTTGDCLLYSNEPYAFDNSQKAGLHSSNEYRPPALCTQWIGFNIDSFTFDGGKCHCQNGRALNGSVENARIDFTGGSSWQTLQFRYCSAKDTFSLGGIRIQRYGNGTPACDEIVPGLCANTAFLSANPWAVSACGCMTEQNRLVAMFAGVDVPVACFSNLCADGVAGVYQSSGQSQGCSARLCSQFISVNGSSISAQGIQTMTCNGSLYSVSSASTVDIGETPTVGVSVLATDSSTIGFDSSFYIALGLLVLMMLLLGLYGVRRLVEHRRESARQRGDETELLQQALSNRT
jgi:hypothetical protein